MGGVVPTVDTTIRSMTKSKSRLERAKETLYKLLDGCIHNPGAALVGIVIVGIVAVFVGGVLGVGPAAADETQQIGQETCEKAFGSEWEYRGYVTTYPPAIQCKGPHGENGVAPMPQEMQERLNIVVANSTMIQFKYNDSTDAFQ